MSPLLSTDFKAKLCLEMQRLEKERNEWNSAAKSNEKKFKQERLRYIRGRINRIRTVLTKDQSQAVLLLQKKTQRINHQQENSNKAAAAASAMLSLSDGNWESSEHSSSRRTTHPHDATSSAQQHLPTTTSSVARDTPPFHLHGKGSFHHNVDLRNCNAAQKRVAANTNPVGPSCHGTASLHGVAAITTQKQASTGHVAAPAQKQSQAAKITPGGMSSGTAAAARGLPAVDKATQYPAGCGLPVLAQTPGQKQLHDASHFSFQSIRSTSTQRQPTTNDSSSSLTNEFNVDHAFNATLKLPPGEREKALDCLLAILVAERWERRQMQKP